MSDTPEREYDHAEYVKRIGDGYSPDESMEHAIEAHQCARYSRRLETPRGTFVFRFASMEEAKAHGYGLWFSHEGTNIVANGTRAFAVDS